MDQSHSFTPEGWQQGAESLAFWTSQDNNESRLGQAPEDWRSWVQSTAIVIYRLHNAEWAMDAPHHRQIIGQWHGPSRPVTVRACPKHLITNAKMADFLTLTSIRAFQGPPSAYIGSGADFFSHSTQNTPLANNDMAPGLCDYWEKSPYCVSVGWTGG